MLSVVILCVVFFLVMLSFIMLSVVFFYCYNECHHAECCFAECHDAMLMIFESKSPDCFAYSEEVLSM
jgi:hypothetical protein